MRDVNEVLLELVAHRAIDREQYSTYVARRMVRMLARTDARLAAEIASSLTRVSADSFRIQRLTSMLSSVRELNAQTYAAINQALNNEIDAFSAHEAAANYELMLRVIPKQLEFRIAGVAATQIQAAVLARPFQGHLLSEWGSKIEADRMLVVRNAIRGGIVEGRTISQIVGDIRGTKTRQYLDGALSKPRRELETVVRTAVSHTAAVARDVFVKENVDIVASVRWLSVLDQHTSSPCRIRDGLQYTAVGHKPVDHKIPWGAGPGRFHFNCRSTSVPVIKSWRQFGLSVDELPPGTRASMSGQVPANLSYRDWFLQQPASRQEEILGPARSALIRKGGLKVPDFYTSTGVELTLDQLRLRDAASFARAGL